MQEWVLNDDGSWTLVRNGTRTCNLVLIDAEGDFWDCNGHPVAGIEAAKAYGEQWLASAIARHGEV